MGLRTATLRDIDGLRRLQKRAHDRAWPHRTWEAEFERPNGAIWLLDAGRRTPVALLVMWRMLDAVEIVDLAVDPGERRQGVATMLLEAAIAVANVRDVKRIALEVRESNEEAIAFYEALQFVVVDRLCGYYDDGQTALKMVRNIGD